MSQTVALNLRGFDAALRDTLRKEAGALGLTLQEYAAEILSGTRSRQAQVPRGNIALLAQPAIKQDEPPAYGDWDSAAPQAGAALLPVSGPGVVSTPAQPARRTACQHGYMNRAICPQCRAAAQ